MPWYFVRPFYVLALFGLALSLGVHIMALLGLPPTPEVVPALLTIVGMVVSIAAYLAAKRHHPGKERLTEEELLSGCPPHLRRAAFGAFVYGLVCMAVLFLAGPRREPSERRGWKESSWVRAGGSAMMLGWYAMCAAALRAALTFTGDDPPRRCANGHLMLPKADRCTVCGECAA